MKKKKANKEYKELIERFKRIAGVDLKIYLYKWYPWSYKNYIPTLVLQGWYNLSSARKFYLKKYGPDSLKYIKFSKGKTILESGDFKVGKSLYINGKWIVVNSKRYTPEEDKQKVLHQGWKSFQFKQEMMKSLKKRTRGHNDRVYFDQDIIYFQHERTTIPKNSKKENLKLQKVQETKSQRKKTLFEEPE